MNDDQNNENENASSNVRQVDFSSGKKGEADPQSQSFFKRKNWNITYKKDSWGSGNGDQVAPSSAGNSGFRKGGAKKKSNPSFFDFSKIPVFTRFVIVAVLIVHFVMSFVVPETSQDKVFLTFSFIPGLFLHFNEGLSILNSLSPVSYMFLHGSWVHVAFNSIMMVSFGTLVERRYGASLAAPLFFIGGIAGAATFWIISPQAVTPLIGASAGMSALFGAAILMLSADTQGLAHMGGRRMPRSRVIIVVWIAIMALTGLMGGDNVAWPSHIGGFLAGICAFKYRHVWHKP